jgi:hypothetical protein
MLFVLDGGRWLPAMQCEASPVELKTGVSCNQNRKNIKTRKLRAKDGKRNGNTNNRKKGWGDV